jgi:undecaprenyl diphosphate synthase
MSLPVHIAIIPDGNRRWAKAQGKPSLFGHQRGFEVGEQILEEAFRLGIKHVTMWGGSIDNLTKRDPQEIAYLMVIYEKLLKDLTRSTRTAEYNTRIQVLGRWSEYCTKGVIKAAESAMAVTKDHAQTTLNLLLAYNGNDEMLTAINKLIVTGKPVTGEDLKQALYTHNLPPVDLVIRTGDDPHLSNGFMMWDTQNAELYFPLKLWPDFSVADLNAALDTYAKTGRRMGK